MQELHHVQAAFVALHLRDKGLGATKFATEQPTKFVMAPSRIEGSTDRYVGHRHTSIASLSLALEALMAE